MSENTLTSEQQEPQEDTSAKKVSRNIYSYLPLPKLHVMVIRTFFGPFLMSFVVTLFILVLQFITKYADDIFGKNLDEVIISKILLYASSTLTTLALPLAVLFSSLMTVGNMGERYELAAVKSAGISLWKVMRPMSIFTGVIIVGALYFSFYIVPKANFKLYSLLFDVTRVKPTLVIKPGHFYDGLDGYVIHVADKNESGTLYDVKIFDHSDDRRRGNNKILLADSARMMQSGGGKYMTMQLFSGVNHQVMESEGKQGKSMEYGRYYFDSLYYHFQLSGFEMEQSSTMRLSPHHYMKNIHELSEAVDSVDKKARQAVTRLKGYIDPILHLDSARLFSERPPPDSATEATLSSLEGKRIYEAFPEYSHRDIVKRAANNARTAKNYAKFSKDKNLDETRKKRKYSMEYYNRWALPISCLAFLLIGAPLGAVIRKGGLGIPLIVSVLFFVLFYVLMIQGKKFAKDGYMETWAGLFLPHFVLFPIGFILIYQSATDSPLLDTGYWASRIKSFIRSVRIKLGADLPPEYDEEVRDSEELLDRLFKEKQQDEDT